MGNISPAEGGSLTLQGVLWMVMMGATVGLLGLNFGTQRSLLPLSALPLAQAGHVVSQTVALRERVHAAASELTKASDAPVRLPDSLNGQACSKRDFLVTLLDCEISKIRL